MDEERYPNLFAAYRGFKKFLFVVVVILIVVLLLRVFFHFKRARVLNGEIRGKVVRIADGDGFTLLKDNRQIRVRLWGIDAPEMRGGQPYCQKSKQYLASMVFQKDVRLVVKDMDIYGRTVALVFDGDGKNVNQEMLRAGLAWWYRHFAPDEKTLEALEKEAKDAGRGLWQDKNPIPPWDWRRGRRK